MSKGKIALFRGQTKVDRGLDITAKSASGVRSKKLAPSWAMVLAVKNGSLSQSDYTEQYHTQLEELGRDFWIALGQYARSKGGAITFLCYCPSKDAEGKPYFCHTRLVCRWLADHEVYGKWFHSDVEL